MPHSAGRRTTRQMAIVLGVVGMLLGWSRLAYAQHGNYLLGTLGLLGGAQAPEGIYYQNIFSYYHASDSLILEASRTRDLQLFGQQLGLTVDARFKGKANLDAYVDQNIVGMTTPLKIFGGNYGFMIDIPFDAVQGTNDAGLDVGANLKGLFDRNLSTSASFSRSRSATADFNISDIYVEPINFGWHLS